jgi:peptidoglycan-associated lipoprotein
MRRIIALLLTGVLVIGAALVLTGCGAKEEEFAEPTGEPYYEETDALAGEDIPLTEQPSDTIYIEPLSTEFADIYFEFDKYNIRPMDERKLQGIASWLEEYTDVRVLIEGHCDERGTNEYNMALGEQRALAARRFLIGLGISGSRINTISYGEERPVDSGHSESAWAKNRRAHFAVSQ